jgi:hypothetical protein
MKKSPNQALRATAVKRLGWQVGCQTSAVPELTSEDTSTGFLSFFLLRFERIFADFDFVK